MFYIYNIYLLIRAIKLHKTIQFSPKKTNKIITD